MDTTMQTLPLTPESWITSDSHWGHDNIQRFQSRPSNHYEKMRSLWEEQVSDDDVILHLGDLVCFAHRRPERPESWVEGLPGQKYIILGNHDHYKQDWYRELGFTVLGRGGEHNASFKWRHPETGVCVAFSHEPLTCKPHGWSINVHGHIHRGFADSVSLAYPQVRRINACVELTGYGPVRLGKLLDSATMEALSTKEWAVAATREDIKRWIEQRPEDCTHMLVICDTYDYEDYPLYYPNDGRGLAFGQDDEPLKPEDSVEVVAGKLNGTNMRKVMECYSFTGRHTIGEQLRERRARHYD